MWETKRQRLGVHGGLPKEPVLVLVDKPRCCSALDPTDMQVRVALSVPVTGSQIFSWDFFYGDRGRRLGWHSCNHQRCLLTCQSHDQTFSIAFFLQSSFHWTSHAFRSFTLSISLFVLHLLTLYVQWLMKHSRCAPIFRWAFCGKDRKSIWE